MANILNTSLCAKGANFVVYGKKEKNEVSSEQMKFKWSM